MPNIFRCLIHCFQGKRGIDIKNPYPLLLAHTDRLPHWTKHDSVLTAIEHQRVPRRQLQLIPNRFRKNNPPSLVNS